MLAAVTSAITTVIGWVGTFITALTDSENGDLVALLPLFAVGIAISAVLLGKLFAQVKSVEKSGSLNILHGNQIGSLSLTS